MIAPPLRIGSAPSRALTASSLARARAFRTGFTMIELMLVIAILATVAGGIIVAVEGTEAHARGSLGRVEVSEVQRAVLQFRADTGFLPKRGPFDLAGRGPGKVVLAAGLDAQWFDHPANLTQLVTNPLPASEPLSRWNPDTRRGWRGPYLRCEGWVRVPSGLPLDGASDWTLGPLLASPVPAIADPFAAGTTLFEWQRSEVDALVVDRGRRPFLLLGVSTQDPATDTDDEARAQARVVSLGVDGRFDPPATGACVGGDDVGAFLLR